MPLFIMSSVNKVILFFQILKQQQLHLSELMEINQQKDDIIERLRTENLENPHVDNPLLMSQTMMRILYISDIDYYYYYYFV